MKKTNTIKITNGGMIIDYGSKSSVKQKFEERIAEIRATRITAIQSIYNLNQFVLFINKRY